MIKTIYYSHNKKIILFFEGPDCEDLSNRAKLLKMLISHTYFLTSLLLKSLLFKTKLIGKAYGVLRYLS